MTREPTIKLLVILGPTATGKSDIAVSLAKMIEKEQLGGYNGAEIISADSRQVYKGMDIGTGKITSEEMQGVPHHLLDVADPRKQFSVIDWKNLAERAIYDIKAKNKLPIICGGTGFYIDTLINSTDFPAIGANKELRKTLNDKSAADLFKMLQKLDRVRASKMNNSDSQNPRRLIRAIEIATANLETNDETTVPSDELDFVINSVQKMESRLADSYIQSDPHKPDRMVAIKSTLRPNYEPIFIGLQLPQEELRKRIHDRLLRRIDNGMLDEVRRLHKTIKNGGASLTWKRMNELGLEYRYMAEHLQGNMDLAKMTEKLEIAISQYAKRQITWFKRNKEIQWFKPADLIEIEKLVKLALST